MTIRKIDIRHFVCTTGTLPVRAAGVSVAESAKTNPSVAAQPSRDQLKKRPRRSSLFSVVQVDPRLNIVAIAET